jgi:hypothetical protein
VSYLGDPKRILRSTIADDETYATNLGSYARPDDQEARSQS